MAEILLKLSVSRAIRWKGIGGREGSNVNHLHVKQRRSESQVIVVGKTQIVSVWVCILSVFQMLFPQEWAFDWNWRREESHKSINKTTQLITGLKTETLWRCKYKNRKRRGNRWNGEGQSWFPDAAINVHLYAHLFLSQGCCCFFQHDENILEENGNG